MNPKSTLITMLLLTAILAACSGGNTSSSATSDSFDTKAVAVVESIAAGNYAAVVADFDATMAAALPEATLRQTWEGLTAQVGAYQSHGAARTADEMGLTAVYVPCTFERGSLNAKIVYGTDGKIAGLFFQP